MSGGWRDRAVVATTKLAWLQARHGFVTASDVSALFGCNPHMTRARLLRDKAGPVKDARGSSAMRAGQFMEAGIFAWWMDDYTTTQSRAGLPPPTGGIVRHASGTSVLVPHISVRLAASPDAVIEDELGEALVEIKAHGPRVWGEGLPPTGAYLCETFEGHTLGLDERCTATATQYLQVQSQMMCTGIQRAWLVRACGTERRDSIIPPCASIQDAISSRVTKFWEDFEHGL